MLNANFFQFFYKFSSTFDFVLLMEYRCMEQLCEYSRIGDLESIRRLLGESKKFSKERLKEAMVSVCKDS